MLEIKTEKLKFINFKRMVNPLHVKINSILKISLKFSLIMLQKDKSMMRISVIPEAFKTMSHICRLFIFGDFFSSIRKSRFLTVSFGTFREQVPKRSFLYFADSTAFPRASLHFSRQSWGNKNRRCMESVSLQWKNVSP